VEGSEGWREVKERGRGRGGKGRVWEGGTLPQTKIDHHTTVG